MSRLSFMLCVATAMVASSAMAAEPTHGSSVEVPQFDKHEVKTTNLSPIVVYGHKMPLPIQLQLYKKALTRSWSTDPDDLDKMVCYWTTSTGTHFQYLRCNTNRMHLKQYETMQLALATGTGIPMELAGLTLRKRVSRSTLAPLLEKMPAADATYTLRVTDDDGKPVLDYIIKNGELAHINRYVYKDDKSTKSKE